MTSRFHGVFTLTVLGCAGAVAFIALVQESAVLAIIYLAVSMVALLSLFYLFCGKCACREDSCAMVLPAKISKLLPERKGDSYTFWDLFFVVLFLVILAMFPQYWLWKHKALFIFYWLLFMVAHTEITFIVCKRCENTRCPINKRMGCRKSIKNPRS